MPWDTFQDDDEDEEADEEEDCCFPLHHFRLIPDHVAMLGELPFDIAFQEEQELDEDGNVVPHQAS